MSNREVKKIDNLEKELFSEDERIELWIRRNWLKTAIAALAVVIIGVTIYAYIHYSKKAVEAKQMALANTETEKLTPKIIEDNRDVPGAAVATLRMAEKMISDGKYADAAAALAPLQSDKKVNVELRQKAFSLQAYALEQAGKDADLLAFFRNAATADFTEGFKAQCEWQVARLLIAGGKTDEAAKTLKRVIDREKANAGDMLFAQWAVQCRQTLVAIESGDFSPVKK